MWKVQWSGDCEQEVRTLEDLEALLDRVHLEHENTAPVLVVMESPANGDSLAIGLGRSLSVLNFVPGSGDPPYLTSLGPRTNDDTIKFDFMGELSEFPSRNAVPIDVARQAVREFFEAGMLSNKVRWEQD